MKSNETSAQVSAPQADPRANPMFGYLAVLLIQILYPVGSLLLVLTSNSKSGMLPSFILMQVLTFWTASRFSLRAVPFAILWFIGAISFGILHLPWLFR